MRSIRLDVQGFSRTYWDVFQAAGFSVGIFYLFTAVLAWQLGSLPAKALAGMRVVVWALAVCFAAITVVSWKYLFMLPIVFSAVITSCLTAAAWRSGSRCEAGDITEEASCYYKRRKGNTLKRRFHIGEFHKPTG